MILGQNYPHKGIHYYRTFSNPRGLPFLKAVLKETYRMRPSAPAVGRILEKDIVLSGYKVPAGTLVQGPPFISCADLEVFIHPDEFDPFRWLKIKEDFVVPHFNVSADYEKTDIDTTEVFKKSDFNATLKSNEVCPWSDIHTNKNFENTNSEKTNYNANREKSEYNAMEKNEKTDYKANREKSDYNVMEENEKANYNANREKSDYNAMEKNEKTDYKANANNKKSDYNAMEENEKTDYKANSENEKSHYNANSNYNECGYYGQFEFKKSNVHPYAILPFGHGARMCPGRRIAEQEIYLAIIKLIQDYKIERTTDETCLDTMGEDLYLGQVMRLNMVPAGPISLRFKKRR